MSIKIVKNSLWKLTTMCQETVRLIIDKLSQNRLTSQKTALTYFSYRSTFQNRPYLTVNQPDTCPARPQSFPRISWLTAWSCCRMLCCTFHPVKVWSAPPASSLCWPSSFRLLKENVYIYISTFKLKNYKTRKCFSFLYIIIAVCFFNVDTFYIKNIFCY